MSNQITHILAAENIIVDLEVVSKEILFEQIGLIIEKQQGISRSLIAENLLEREKLGSTALGHGVAVPHGRIKTLKKPIALFVRLTQAIAFDAPDHQDVKLLFILLMPQGVQQTHLELLSEIAEIFSDTKLREELTKQSSAQIYQQLQLWQPTQIKA